MLQNHLKIAWRNLVKNKVTGFINIIGLAIGMAVAMAISLWMRDELAYNKYYDNYDTLTQLHIHQTFNDKINTGRPLSLPWATALKKEYNADFEEVALASWPSDRLLTVGDNRFLKSGRHVEANFPKMFSLKMIAGNYENALTDPHSIIIAESLAKALFGEVNPMGETLKYENTHDLQVTGIFEDIPRNAKFHNHKLFTSWKLYLETNSWVVNSVDSWGNHSFPIFAQLKKNVTVETVSEKIRYLEREHNKHGNPDAFLHPMSKWHLYSDFKAGINTGGRIQFVWLFGIIGIFVLLLACINFMNLSTARSEKRAKEVGVRKSIGSLRGQLIAQFLVESLLVATLAMVLSLVMVQLSLPSFNELADKKLGVPMTEPFFWITLFGFTLFTGLLSGSYPAFYLSSFEPIKALKGTFKVGRWAGVPRKVLVTLQFTVSIALIIGTIVVFQQIQHAKNRPTGYENNRLLHFFSNTETIDKQDVVRTELIKTGVVEDITTSSSPVTAIWSNQIGFDWQGKDPEFTPAFGIVAVSENFGQTVNWNIIEGRDFSKNFGTDSSAIILNESAVDLIGLNDIVGTRIKWNEENCLVVGVVENMIMESPWIPIKPTVFHVNSDQTNIFTLKLKEGVPLQDALSTLEDAYAQLSPSSPFEFEFIDDEYDEKFQTEERVGKLARVFAILAIFISCLGLFGLSTFVAEQRTKEIGIRKVLGASVTNLWSLQSKSFAGLVLLSCLIAAPLAWYYLEGWLADYEYRIDLSWKTFVIAGLLALVVTMLTVSYQSLKAALANPVESLRSE